LTRDTPDATDSSTLGIGGSDGTLSVAIDWGDGSGWLPVGFAATRAVLRATRTLASVPATTSTAMMAMMPDVEERSVRPRKKKSLRSWASRSGRGIVNTSSQNWQVTINAPGSSGSLAGAPHFGQLRDASPSGLSLSLGFICRVRLFARSTSPGRRIAQQYRQGRTFLRASVRASFEGCVKAGKVGIRMLVAQPRDDIG
jgi:hypothetical protein